MKKNESFATRRSPLRASVYREAARRAERLDILEGETGDHWKYGYACNAIQTVMGLDPVDDADACETLAFKAVFSPGRENEFGFFGPMHHEVNRNRRILALCFMAAMVEAGDA